MVGHETKSIYLFIYLFIYFIANRKCTFKDINILNKFTTTSDQRMVATIEIHIKNVRYKMIKKKRTKS